MVDIKPVTIAAGNANLYSKHIGLTMRKTLMTLIIVLYIKYDAAKGSGVDPPGVCETSECQELASNIAKSINFSVDPCDDFYQFACGGWVAEHPIPDDASWVDISSPIFEENMKIMKDLLTLDDPKAPEAIKQARAFFRSCNDINTMDSLGKNPLLELLNIDGSGIYPTLQSSWTDTGMKFIDIVEYLSTLGKIGANTFIKIGLWHDKEQSDTIIVFFQPDLLLESRDMYVDQENSTELKLLENLYRQVLEALGADATTAAQDARDVVDFEIQLANALISDEELFNRSNQIQKMSLADLTTMFPQFEWLRYLRGQLNRTDITLNEMVFNTALHYCNNLFTLVNTTSVRTLLNYGVWRSVYDALPYLGNQLRGMSENFRQVLYGTTQLPERWKECLDDTNTYFQFAVSRLYVDNKFSTQDKEKVENIIESVIKTLKEMVQGNTWMTESAKEKAFKKLNFVTKKIAYPTFIFNDATLNSKSEMYNVDENKFFMTKIDVSKNYRLSMLNKLHQPVNRNEWSVLESASDVLAYYSAQNNEIVIPAGLLVPPYYSGNFSSAIIYGAIGTIIAHELTHVFDTAGGAFDETGKVIPWWYKDDLKNYQSRAQCVVDQYSQFVDKELNMTVDGLVTLEENIADIVAIREAYRAYRTHITETGREEDKYTSLPYTQDQLFFVGFAQTYCESSRLITREITMYRSSTGPNNFRVLGTLQNSEDFGQVFNCSVQTPMNPQTKCRVW